LSIPGSFSGQTIMRPRFRRLRLPRDRAVMTLAKIFLDCRMRSLDAFVSMPLSGDAPILLQDQSG
jgi:hypothetical protein